MNGGLVTGEAVTLDLAPARLPSRMLALTIDITVQLIVLGLGFAALVQFGTGLDSAAAAAVSITLLVLVLVGMPAGIETWSHGRSLGKLAFGLRVVRDDGGPVRFRHALVRALFLVFVDLWVTSGTVGLISSLVSRQGKRVGDQFAGTVVVRERVATASRAYAAVTMPAPLAGWAATADLAGLPDDLALAARQFVLRAPSLAAPARQALAQQLAGQVSGRIGPPPPPGTPPEAYLAAVIAERTRRAWWAQSQQALGGQPPTGPGGWPMMGSGPTYPPPAPSAIATPPGQSAAKSPLRPAPPNAAPPTQEPPNPGFTAPR